MSQNIAPTAAPTQNVTEPEVKKVVIKTAIRAGSSKNRFGASTPSASAKRRGRGR